ncbi:unnamed protein product [Effrenium voratum]|nr:unnamed protein product [Effrenium voratum]
MKAVPQLGSRLCTPVRSHACEAIARKSNPGKIWLQLAPVVCHSSCEKCDGGTEADCLSCKGLRFMHEKKCLEECPDGRFGHKESKSCMPCHESCATCSSEEAADCQSCPSGQFLHEGCKESCPDLFFADGDSICKPLAGAVVALKTQGDKAMLVYSNDTNCVKLVELAGDEQEDPSNIDDESKMWMVAGTSKNTASFRNVKTGLALQMPSSELSQLDNSGCATEINTCAVARPPKPIPGETSLWTDNQWGVYKCDKSSFGITSHGNSIISLSLEDRYLKAGKLLGLSNQVEPGSSLGQELRFEPLFVLPAVKSLRKTSGRCQNLITQSLQCSAAAGGQAIDDFADFTEQSTDPKFPPGCYYYQQEILAPKDKGYKDLPMTANRTPLGRFSSAIAQSAAAAVVGRVRRRASAAEAWEAERAARPSPMMQAAAQGAKAKAAKPQVPVTEKTTLPEKAPDKAADDVQVVPDSVPGASKANFSRIYSRGEWDLEAQSGLGSREETTREFRSFLEDFLASEHIFSVCDAGCGHWPSGYQRFMDWRQVRYTGLDVVPYVVQENIQYFQDVAHLQQHGLQSAEFLCADVSEDLPAADLLLVKDVLMHLPNRAVHDFLQKSVNRSSPRYRAVMLVQNAVPPVAIREMVDIQPGQLLPFDITFPPFKAEGFETVFRWQSDEPKVVQLWKP